MSEYATSEIINLILDKEAQEDAEEKAKIKREKEEMEAKWQALHQEQSAEETAFAFKILKKFLNDCRDKYTGWCEFDQNEHPIIKMILENKSPRTDRHIDKTAEILEILKRYITLKEIHTRKLSEPRGSKFILLHINVHQNEDAEKIEEWLKNG